MKSAQSLQNLESIQSRQAHVQDDQVKRCRLSLRDCVLAIVSDHRIMSRFNKRRGHMSRDANFVINYENAHTFRQQFGGTATDYPPAVRRRKGNKVVTFPGVVGAGNKAVTFGSWRTCKSCSIARYETSIQIVWHLCYDVRPLYCANLAYCFGTP